MASLVYNEIAREQALNNWNSNFRVMFAGGVRPCGGRYEDEVRQYTVDFLDSVDHNIPIEEFDVFTFEGDGILGVHNSLSFDCPVVAINCTIPERYGMKNMKAVVRHELAHANTQHTYGQHAEEDPRFVKQCVKWHASHRLFRNNTY